VTEPKTARELIATCRTEDRHGNATANEYERMTRELRYREHDAFEPMLTALEAVRVAIDQGKRMYKPEKPGVRLYLLDEEIALIRRALSIADGKEPR
jgi:hypothetical protein